MFGLIFGETDLPHKILKVLKKKGIKYTIIDLTKKNVFKKNINSYSFSIGQFGKIINKIKEKKCKKVLFAGKVKKPNFSKLKLDLKGIYYISRIIKSSKVGDAAVLKEIIKILKKEGIKTINSLIFNPELSLKKGIYTKNKPNKNDNIDIKKALYTLNKISKYNFTQGVVVRNNVVVAIEGRNGTEEMLKKCKKENLSTGVLVKFPKKKQDLRIDLPTIGFKTLTQCKQSNIKGIVLKSSKHVFLDKEKCITFANKNKMFISVK